MIDFVCVAVAEDQRGVLPPPPEGFVSPMLWGVEGQIVERFGKAGVATENISMVKDRYCFISAEKGPAEVIEMFRRFYGPTMNAFEAAGKSGRVGELQGQLLALAGEHNRRIRAGGQDCGDICGSELFCVDDAFPLVRASEPAGFHPGFRGYPEGRARWS